MQISRKLQNKIRQAIYDANRISLDSIDKEFREGRISRDAWDVIHKAAIQGSMKAEAEAVSIILMYRR